MFTTVPACSLVFVDGGLFIAARSLAGTDKGNADTNAENMELDETPIVIIIPGLTSSSEAPVRYEIVMLLSKCTVQSHFLTVSISTCT